MKQKQEHAGKRLMGLLLALAMMFSLIGGTGLTAQAADTDSEEPQATVTSTAEETGEGTDEGTDETDGSEDETLYDVYFSVSPSNATVTVSKGLVYTYVEDIYEGSTETGLDNAEGTESYVYSLPAGNYTATINMQESGWYASEFSFVIAEDGTITSSVSDILSDNVFSISLDSYTVSTVSGAWDGITLDVSWYTETGSVYYISTPEQFAGLAAIVNGIYNAEIICIIDDQDGDGTTENYTPREYAALDGCKINPALSTGETGGPEGYSTVTSSTYWYGVMTDGATQSDFNGKYIYLTSDIDMGGVCSDDTWTGPRYMPVAGQWVMHYVTYSSRLTDAYSRLSSSFNGKLYGQGHIVANVYGDRYVTSAYGDSVSVGLVGRLGTHDSDPVSLAAEDPTVSGVAVSGYIRGRRSVGGIVGKIGQTSASKSSDGSTGGMIEKCLNFASISSTDAKGCGGIVGAGWNSGEVVNCVNFGDVTNVDYASCPVGGISGSNEVPIANCYNVGLITAYKDSFAMAIGTKNGGSGDILNCYWLTGTAPGGGYYNASSGSTVYEVTDNYNDSGLTASAFMQSAAYLTLLNGTDRVWVYADTSDAIYTLMAGYSVEGYPVPREFTNDTSYVTEVQVVIDEDVLTTEYTAGQTFDDSGITIWAVYSDNTMKQLTDYTVTPSGELTQEDTQVTVSGTWEGVEYSRTISISVSSNAVNSIVISTAPNTLYASDEVDSFSVDGMVVQAYYTDAPDTAVTLDSDAYTWELNGTTLTVSYTYGGVTVTDSLEITILGSPAPTQNEEGYYEIGNEDALLWFANQVNALGNTDINGKLTADLSPSSDFTGIGSMSSGYAGSFDGNGYTVTLSVSSTGAAGAGLFNGISGATIENVTVAGTVESSYSYTAGLVGYIKSGENSIKNCVNKADITATGSYTGGLIGIVSSGIESVTVEDCVNEGSISGTSYVGGIGGYIYKNCYISGCLNSGAITATASSSYAGGIVGYTYPGSESMEISDCGNEGTVTGNSYVGGIVAYAYRTTSGELILDGLYNTGTVSGTSYVGGIVGRNRTSLSNVYNLGAVSGTAVSTGGIAGNNYLKATVLSNAYNAGEVTYTSSDVTYTGGLLVGSVTSSSYLMYVDNAYYLSTLDGSAVASGSRYLYSNSTQVALTDDELAAMVKTSDELAALAETLGDSFVTNTDSDYHLGYPVLTWEETGEDEEALQIITQPEDYTGTVGSTAVFEVEATGSSLTYQWQYLNAGASTWRDSGMSGADTASISVPVTEARDGQQYRCVVTDGGGNTVTSDAATLTVSDDAGFSITLQPSDYTGLA
ncbi:MAG: hypothetical protein LUE97_04785, partial [Oscillospiraceae bacterium]|nr:hypothetical protein [Oscillospiraceae bacterium]